MERHYLTMRYIIKAVNRPVGATEHFISVVVVVVVNLCFTSLFGTKGLLSDIVIR